VVFVGALNREAVADLFAAASVTLVPSHSESFGLVALESAASATPVVASNTTGLIDAVANGESGVLVDGRDPEAWAIAVGTLLDALEVDGNSIGHSAREFAVTHTWAAAADSLVAVYESL
jgi:D-inositol-3-phosphate glycosyltransferase